MKQTHLDDFVLFSWGKCGILNLQSEVALFVIKKLTNFRTIISFLYPTENSRGSRFLMFSGNNKGNMARSWLGARFCKSEKKPYPRTISFEFNQITVWCSNLFWWLGELHLQYLLGFHCHQSGRIFELKICLAGPQNFHSIYFCARYITHNQNLYWIFQDIYCMLL